MKKVIIISLIFSVLFSSCEWIDSKIGKDEDTDTIVSGLFIGIIGFNDTVSINPMTSNITQVKSFVNKLSNKTDATAMCYGISEGINQLKGFNENQSIDQSYIVVFTDGFDNYSANYFNGIYQSDVIGYTRDLLLASVIENNPTKCFTIGLSGKGVLKDSELEDLAVNGEYKKANTYTLNSTFDAIANSLIATSKNFSFKTNVVPISNSEPKYVQIKIGASNSPTSAYLSYYYIEGIFHNVDGKTPTFIATSISENVIFDGDDGSPISGNIENKKVYIPLKNLNIKSSSTIYYIDYITVKIRWSESENWVEDVEDAKIEESIAKNIAVVLVLDCSSSLGDDFSNLKEYSNNLINTLMDNKKQ